MGLEEKVEEKKDKNDGRNLNALTAQKHRILNICVLGFVAVLTVVGFITFYIAVGRGSSGAAYSIASIYVLCMLLAAPTLKVFLDKVECTLMKRLNIIGIIVIFFVILLIVVSICIMLAGPELF